ncbi:intradiol ring-cleavage dioxygenase [Streptomyces adelaidensis]|uniref:intradiol ring-cleavage dioxygenase n=1 Tax=Streptomyces adelaidensis TaxID=2796465 RepID=UPI001902D13F|nr:intradiol ring-cleavage dioxygenase [Streptomyces adelaidensis]
MTGNQTGNENEQAPTPKHKRDLARRKVVVAGAGAVAAVAVGGAVVATASAGTNNNANKSTNKKGATPLGSTSESAGEECYKLTSETTEGPYYIDADKLRRDITEDKEGIPLVLRLKVIDSETCKPIRNAAVDVWQCDALGLYSGYESASMGGGAFPTGDPSGTPSGTPSEFPGGGSGGIHQEPTSDTRYLRGTSKTDRKGFVTFQTIFPGWYQGRCVHVHVKVHVNGKWTEAGYEGGTTCHTGQFYFEEEAVLASAELDPYSTSTTQRTTLDEDTIYDGAGTQGGLLKLKYKKADIAKGVIGSITVGVDPDAENTGLDLSLLTGGSQTATPSAS